MDHKSLRISLAAFDRIRARQLLGLTVLFLFAAAAVEAAAFPDEINRYREYAWLYLLNILALAWVFHRCGRAGIPPARLIGHRPSGRRWRFVLLAVPQLILAFGTFWLLWAPLSLIFPEFVQQYVLDYFTPIWTPGAPWLNVISVADIVVFAPIIEEIVFRGVLLHRWAYKWGSNRAVIYSSALFAILHLDVIGAFTFALVMCGLYIRTRTLWIPIACHMAYNGLVVILELFSIGDRAYTVADIRADAGIGVIALIMGGTVILMAGRHFLPPPGWVPPLALPPNIPRRKRPGHQSRRPALILPRRRRSRRSQSNSS